METVFKKSFKGYDTAQVDEYIVALSDTYTRKEKEFAEKIHILETENNKLKGAINLLRDEAEETAETHEEELKAKQKEYDALCAEVGEKMVVADKRAADIIKIAEKEAALIIAKAKTDAENEAKATRAKAEEDAERLIADTEAKCKKLSEAAEEFRKKQEEMNKSMFDTEKSFGDAISKIRSGIAGE